MEAEAGMSRGSAIRRILKWLLSPVLLTRGPRGRIYLTFDDGPVPESTPRILDVLDTYGAKATFFMVGSQMKQHSSLVAEVRSRGHTIGYHSFEHHHAGAYSFRAELRDLASVREIAGGPRGAIRHYRPPYGELTLMRLAWCLTNRMSVAMWSLDSRDSFIRSPDELVQKVSPANVRDGEVILFHDDSEATLEALPRILQNLKNAGFSFASL